jgi:hypothetical protein
MSRNPVGQLDIVAGGAHGDRQRPPVDAQLQRLFGGERVMQMVSAA